MSIKLLATSAIIICLPLLAQNKKTTIQIQTPAKESDCYVVATYPIPQAFSVTGEIRSVFGADAEIALAVAKAESHYRADAYHINSNGSVDRGIFQINSVHGYSEAQLFNPKENIQIAYKIFKAQGWQGWSVFNSGAYKSFL